MGCPPLLLLLPQPDPYNNVAAYSAYGASASPYPGDAAQQVPPACLR
jgi:hypothetical protein